MDDTKYKEELTEKEIEELEAKYGKIPEELPEAPMTHDESEEIKDE